MKAQTISRRAATVAFLFALAAAACGASTTVVEETNTPASVEEQTPAFGFYLHHIDEAGGGTVTASPQVMALEGTEASVHTFGSLSGFESLLTLVPASRESDVVVAGTLAVQDASGTAVREWEFEFSVAPGSTVALEHIEPFHRTIEITVDVLDDPRIFGTAAPPARGEVAMHVELE